MRLHRPLLARRGRLPLFIAAVLELGVRLRLLLGLRPEPRQAAEQSFEDVAGPCRRPTAAFGVVARDQIAGAAAGARLQVGEIGLHPRDLGVGLAALRGRLRAEKQELAVPAAE